MANQGQIYTLTIINNSANTGDACVYQKPPDGSNPNMMSLAWLTKRAHPSTTIEMDWTIDYSFVWSQTGLLRPGVKFTASQNIPANLDTQNQVNFTKSDGAYTFKPIPPQQGPRSGSLYIMEDDTIPLNEASVGVGMSGSGTFALQAQPNLNLTFTPHPEYWISFGNFTKGTVLDTQSITGAAAVQFPYNVYAMTAVLGIDNKWTIKPTSQMNTEYLQAREKNAKVAWGE
ncbi:hypothetical protein V9L05_17185 [Bernardetia sp. Wsw4-3y2]|uniref:hypothetical protein n=1 Tax=Bernardetia sp. Wsw4-3y2 TaxID=3127471 RepID=UPI0030D206C2